MNRDIAWWKNKKFMKEPQNVSCLLSPLFAQQSENTKWPLRVSNNWSQTQTKYFDLQRCSLFYYDELFLHDSININIYGRHEAQKAYNTVVLSFVLIHVFVLKFLLLS